MDCLAESATPSESETITAEPGREVAGGEKQVASAGEETGGGGSETGNCDNGEYVAAMKELEQQLIHPPKTHDRPRMNELSAKRKSL